ncbi:CinA family protein [Cucumibacter marinus]|uniref:CinA family protein n=1 Tax=Cucumibacter marinus TaxID=1121252 RepID=UPI0003F9A317|nr:CinA family protein [Cucumibacter marinus]
MFDAETTALASRVIDALTARGMMMVTGESCTGGLIAGALTSVSGSSSAVYGGFVTYANEAKRDFIGVPMALIEDKGAVSEEVARAMAEGALKTSGADLAVAVTGVAGPDGGTPDKPVGLVHFGCAIKGLTIHREERFGAIGREVIRAETVKTVLRLVLEVLDQA